MRRVLQWSFVTAPAGKDWWKWVDLLLFDQLVPELARLGERELPIEH